MRDYMVLCINLFQQAVFQFNLEYFFDNLLTPQMAAEWLTFNCSILSKIGKLFKIRSRSRAAAAAAALSVFVHYSEYYLINFALFKIFAAK